MEPVKKLERLWETFPKLSVENQQDALDLAQRLWRKGQGAEIPPKKGTHCEYFAPLSGFGAGAEGKRR
jgi:hypothetical protein